METAIRRANGDDISVGDILGLPVPEAVREVDEDEVARTEGEEEADAFWGVVMPDRNDDDEILGIDTDEQESEASQ